jgi:hypothetical protein
MNVILTCYGRSRISEIFHTFEIRLSYLYIHMLFLILVTRYEQTVLFIFLFVYFQLNLLTSIQ